MRFAALTVVLLIAGAGASYGQSETPATTPTVFGNPALVQTYQATITPQDLAAHLYLIASDDFEGRATGTRGQKLAARYLASQYRRLGLAPKGTVATDDPYALDAYFQPFPLYGRRLVRATLHATRDGRAVAASTFQPEAPDGRAFLSFGTVPESQGGLVFAGYGIADPGLGYDDYAALADAGIETAGRWLLLLRDEPLAGPDSSRLPTPDGAPSRWTTQPFEKLRTAFSRAAPAGILIVGDAGPGAIDVAEGAARQARVLRHDPGPLSLSEQGYRRPFPPAYVITRAMADSLLAATGRTVEALQREIDGALRPTVFAVPGVTVESRIEEADFTASTENVAAFLEGTDPALRHEVVVISSHYDHIGLDPLAEGDAVRNGADDDGSGTVAMLEMAEAFARARREGAGPRRSILFLHVTGEEIGLLGSRYFTDHEPLVPLDAIVANLNMDMIGRYDPTHPTGSRDYVYLIGSRLISEELHAINARVNTLTGTHLELDERFNSRDDPNQFYRRSDHWNFGKHGIPFIFYFTGIHDDYHGPDDEPDRVDYDRVARIARLIFATAWQVATQDERPAVSGTGFN